MSTSLTPQQIQHLDQAAVDALSDVDQLAADPETTRRLTERGEAVYGFELTRDLYANGLNGWSLAAWAAFATIRLNQANRRADALLDELAEVRAKRDAYAVEMESLRAQLATANRRADGLAADLRSAVKGNTAWANQVASDVGKCPQCGRHSRSYSRGCSECGFGKPAEVNQEAAKDAVIEAAKAWRGQYGNTSVRFGDVCTGLVAAVDALPKTDPAR